MQKSAPKKSEINQLSTSKECEKPCKCTIEEVTIDIGDSTNLMETTTYRAETIAIANNNGKIMTPKNRSTTPESVLKTPYTSQIKGQYTSFSTPPNDNAMEFQGSFTSIETEHFMIGCVCGFENTDPNGNISTLRIGDRSSGVFLTGGTINSSTNRFRSISIGGLETVLNIYKPNGQYFHLLIYVGTTPFILIDGVKKELLVPKNYKLTSGEIAISGASNFSLLRKFNFADELYAQRLYNNGRWMDTTILDGDKNIGIPIFKYSSDSNDYVVQSHEEFVATLTSTDQGRIKITWPESNGSIPRLRIAPHKWNYLINENPNKLCYVEFKFKEIVGKLNTTAIVYLDGLDGEREVVYRTITKEGDHKVYKCLFYCLNIQSQGPSIATETANGGEVDIWDWNIRFCTMEAEFLPVSISTDGVWANTAGGANLIATGNDRITYNTTPLE